MVSVWKLVTNFAEADTDSPSSSWLPVGVRNVMVPASDKVAVSSNRIAILSFNVYILGFMWPWEAWFIVSGAFIAEQ